MDLNKNNKPMSTAHLNIGDSYIVLMPFYLSNGTRTEDVPVTFIIRQLVCPKCGQTRRINLPLNFEDWPCNKCRTRIGL